MTKGKKWSIVEVSCAMPHDQKLPKFHWGEATNVAVYVQKKVRHQALDNKALKEVLTSVKPGVHHHYIFSFPIYFHVLKDKRNKLEATGRKGMSDRYCEDSKAFRIYIFLVKGILKLVGI